MIEETGTVVGISDDRARVLIPRNASCEGCVGCRTNSSGFGMIAEVPVVRDLDIGDRVRIEGRRLNRLKAGFLVFILPIVLFFAGYVAGGAVMNRLGSPSLEQAMGIITGLLFFAAPFLIIYLVNRRRENDGEFALVITEILEHPETGP